MTDLVTIWLSELDEKLLTVGQESAAMRDILAIERTSVPRRAYSWPDLPDHIWVARY